MRGDPRASGKLWLALPFSTFLACAGFACAGDAWVIATEQVPAQAEPTAGGSGSFAGGVAECAGVSTLIAERARLETPNVLDADHIGVWRGVIDGSATAAFPGSDVSLEIRPDGTGSFSFDRRPAPPAPDDPESAYLCDGGVSGGICGTESGFVGGFSYAVGSLRSRGNVLSFVIVDADPWLGWCQLQTPVATADRFVECGTTWSSLPPGSERWGALGCTLVWADQNEPIDCGRMYSLERCQCARDGCIAAFSTWIDVGLRLSNDLAELTGSLWFKDQTNAVNLRLERQ